NLNAKTYGGELSASYDVSERMRITANYSYLGKHLRLEPEHFDIFGTQLEGNDAKHTFQVRGSAVLPHRVEIDSAVRFVSRLPMPSFHGILKSIHGWGGYLIRVWSYRSSAGICSTLTTPSSTSRFLRP